MKLFRERETPVENIAFIAMMAAIVALISLISALLPLSSVFVMVLVPLVSASCALFCKARYIPIFLLGAFGLAMALSAWNFINTIFYVLPSLITGVVYGVLWKLKVPGSISIFATGVVGFGLFLFSLQLVEWMTGVNMVRFLLTFLAKQDSPAAYEIFPLFALAYSLAQIALAHIFLTYELKRLGKSENSEEKMKRFYPLISLVFGILSGICALFSLKTGYFFFGCTIYFACFSALLFFPKTHWIAWVVLGVGVFASLLLFAGMFKQMGAQKGFLLLLVPLGVVDLSGFLNFVIVEKARPS